MTLYLRTFLIALMGFCRTGLAQDTLRRHSPNLSAELHYIHPFHPVRENYYQFNYGFGGAISENIKRFKISLGFFFNTGNHIGSHEEQNQIVKTKVSLNYYNVPLLFRFRFSNKYMIKQSCMFVTGFITNFLQGFKEVANRGNGYVPTSRIPVGYGMGGSFRLGFQYNRMFSKNASFYTSVYGDYRYHTAAVYFRPRGPGPPNQVPNYEGPPIFLGINLGLEFWFKRQRLGNP
jgi:hypothetical protein